MMNMIEDTGEHIPDAAKEKRTAQAVSDSEVTLRSLFPEPDWLKWIEGGVEPEAACKMCVIYRGLRNKPRPHGGGVSGYVWEREYLKSIQVLEKLFSGVKTKKDADIIMILIHSPAGITPVRFLKNTGG